MESLLNKTVKLNFSLITTPNAIGVIIKETPKTVTIKVIKRTFENKTNNTFPNKKWTKEQKEYYKQFVGFDLKFWKESKCEFGYNRNWKYWSFELNDNTK